jgi:hypothetical protein
MRVLPKLNATILHVLLSLLLLLLSCSGCPVPRDQQPIQELKQLQVCARALTSGHSVTAVTALFEAQQQLQFRPLAQMMAE